jgi:hypothetical protein
MRQLNGFAPTDSRGREFLHRASPHSQRSERQCREGLAQTATNEDRIALRANHSAVRPLGAERYRNILHQEDLRKDANSFHEAHVEWDTKFVHGDYGADLLSQLLFEVGRA